MTTATDPNRHIKHIKKLAVSIVDRFTGCPFQRRCWYFENLRSYTLRPFAIIHDPHVWKQKKGSSSFGVLRGAMGALPPAPRHFALWANSMRTEKETTVLSEQSRMAVA
jgi:hypothetical protein